MIIEYITRSFIELFWIWTGNNPPCPIMACVLLILETTTVVHTCRKSWLDIYVCVYKIFSSSANLAVCILLMVIPKSLKLKYSSTKCRKSALKNKRITSTSESCTDSSQTNRSWFFTNAFVKFITYFVVVVLFAVCQKDESLWAWNWVHWECTASWCRANGKVSIVPSHTPRATYLICRKKVINRTLIISTKR